jgi:hypothetical protein
MRPVGPLVRPEADHLERNDLSESLGGRYVDLYHFQGKRLEVCWKGHSLPYRVFSKDQRVSHTAIVENKRVGHALSIIKAHQDIKRIQKVMTNSEKDRYKKRPRKVYGPTEIEIDSAFAKTAVEMTVWRKAWNDETAPPFPQTLEISRERRFRTFPPHDDDDEYTDISIGRITLSFLSSSNTR